MDHLEPETKNRLISLTVVLSILLGKSIICRANSKNKIFAVLDCGLLFDLNNFRQFSTTYPKFLQYRYLRRFSWFTGFYQRPLNFDFTLIHIPSTKFSSILLILNNNSSNTLLDVFANFEWQKDILMSCLAGHIWATHK